MNVLRIFSPDQPATTGVSIAPEQAVMPGNPAVTAVFGDQRWDLSAADHHAGRTRSETTIDFAVADAFEERWGRALRELAWHQLNTRLPGQATLSPYTCAKDHLRIRRFIRWLEANHPRIYSPAALNMSVIHAYSMHIRSHSSADAPPHTGGNVRSGNRASVETVWSYVKFFSALAAYRDVMTDPLPFTPQRSLLTSGAVGVVRNEENTTKPLPDEVLRPLVSTALRYVNAYAPDILSLRDEALAHWSERPHDKSPFPAWQTTIGECAHLGRPWRGPLAGSPQHVLRREVGNLVASCAVIILYLSGMRPGEICTLTHDCLRNTSHGPTSPARRWRILGRPLKKRIKDPPPVAWVVTNEVVVAVNLLVRTLAPFRSSWNDEHLLLNLDAIRPARGSGGSFPLALRSLGKLVRDLYSVAREQHPGSPEYQLHPAQFRRTLARHIARQPFGIIAGKLQYHHVSTAVFEGYAGSADDSFRLDVEEERELAALCVMEEMRSDRMAGWRPTAGATAVLDTYEEARGIVGEALIDTSASGAELSKALRRAAKRVFSTPLTNCVFDPATARCLLPDERSTARAPNISLCSPDLCGNGCIGPSKAPAWQQLKKAAESLHAAEDPASSRAVLLRGAMERYEGVLNGMKADD